MSDDAMSDHAIDAVITWVDGGDPAHAERLRAHLAGLEGPRPSSADPTRFNDAGELDYCLTSILRFAPWLRQIHIVTDQQVPALMQVIAGSRYADRVRVVDHREIFAGYEQHLPTFNSRAIITMLWRVPGLAERFLYFNDDFVLLRPVTPEDFFRGERMVLRGGWRRQSQHDPLRRLVLACRRWFGGDPARSSTARVRNLAAQEYSARLAGLARDYLRMYHNPFPMRRSTLAQFFAAHPQLLEANLGPKLRSATQFKTECLAACLEHAQGRAVLDNRLATVQLKPDKQWLARMRRKTAAADDNPRYAFACVQSLELASPAARAHLLAWLEGRIGRLATLLAEAEPR